MHRTSGNVLCVSTVILASLLAGPALADWDAGVAAYTASDWPGALREFQGVVAAHPEYAGAHYMLGLTLNRLGRTEEAADALAQASRLEPANGTYCMTAASNLLQVNRADAAGKALAGVQEASLKPKQVPSFLTLQARVKMELGDSQGALELAGRAVKADPDATEARAVEGAVLARLGRDAEAFDAYREAWARSGDPAYGENAVAAGRRAMASGKGKGLATRLADVEKRLGRAADAQ